jgi:hypothetical protein
MMKVGEVKGTFQPNRCTVSTLYFCYCTLNSHFLLLISHFISHFHSIHPHHNEAPAQTSIARNK